MKKTILAISLTLCAGGLSAANIVLNPSFEDPRLAGGQWTLYNTIPNWGINTPPGSVEIQANNLYPVSSNSPQGSSSNAYNGFQWAEIDYPYPSFSPFTASTQIYQDIATTSGQSYLLTFRWAARPGYGEQQMAIFWNPSSGGGNSYVSTQTASSAVVDWQEYQFTFVATSNLTRLGFGSLLSLYDVNNDAIGGNLLDMVTLEGCVGVCSATTGRVTGGTTGGTVTGGTTGGTVTGGTTGGTVTGGTTGGTVTGGTVTGGTTGGTVTGGTTGGTTNGTISGFTTGTTGFTTGTTGTTGDVPEPGSFLMLGAGLAALLALRQKRA